MPPVRSSRGSGLGLVPYPAATGRQQMKKIESPTPETSTKTAMTRRKFVETTAVAGGALVAAPFLGGKAPAYAQARKVHYLQWSSFVPAADVEIDRQAQEFTKATGIEVTV